MIICTIISNWIYAYLWTYWIPGQTNARPPGTKSGFRWQHPEKLEYVWLNFDEIHWYLTIPFQYIINVMLQKIGILSLMIQNTDRFTIDKRFTNRLRWVNIKSLNWTLGKRANLYVTPYHYHCWKDNIGTKLFWSRHASMNEKAFYISQKGVTKLFKWKIFGLSLGSEEKYVLVH